MRKTAYLEGQAEKAIRDRVLARVLAEDLKSVWGAKPGGVIAATGSVTDLGSAPDYTYMGSDGDRF
jgi:hypothetical protein